MASVIKLPKYGLVKSTRVTKVSANSDMKSVINYLGIPYAKPPVGKLRFKPPQRVDRWKGSVGKTDVTSTSLAVQSISYFDYAHSTYFPLKKAFDEKNCTEDCLYLNVFVPEEPKSKPLPVMVYFHGGAFRLGPVTYYDGTAMAGMNDVIIVVPNYRLNIFGFLSMGSSSQCKGNLGLLDQVEALRWVKENIKYFGGDEENVTIFGQSAGGISVHWHMMSPLSQGLFNKAISCSGAATAIKCFIKDQSRPYQKLLDILGIKDENEEVIFNKLQSIPAELLLRADEQMLMMGYMWMATLDDNFFTDTPENLLSCGKLSNVPYLLGFNSDEGGWSMQDMYAQYREGFSEKEFFKFGMSMLKWFDKSINPQKAIKFLAASGYHDTNVPQNMKYSKLHSTLTADTIFVLQALKAAEKHAELGKETYLYYLNHAPLYNHDNRYGPVDAHKAPFVGADHSDENLLVFGFPFMNNYLREGFRFSEGEKELSRMIMRFFTNFARTGNPNNTTGTDVELSPKWPVYEQKTRQHMCFDTPQCYVGNNIAMERLNLYLNILPKL